MLELKNYSLKVNDKELFNNLNLKMDYNECHVLMGKNGIGKSSIVKSIIGDNDYKVEGSILLDGTDITKDTISKRALSGIYFLNQQPPEIEGVTNAEMLRVAVGLRNSEQINIFKFNKELETICDKLELDRKFIHKEINLGASGGEKKKIELMHLWMLKPKVVILDEIDSGLDVDALKIVGNSLKEYFNTYKPLLIIITHNKGILEYFDNFKVHLLSDKSIILSGDKTLANDILNKGYKEILKTNIISENNKDE